MDGIVEAINEILTDGEIAEIKREPSGFVVVSIKRRIEYPPKPDRERSRKYRSSKGG